MSQTISLFTQRCDMSQNIQAVITSTYDLHLVMLSFLIAVIASYIALELAGRVKSTSGKTRFSWLLGGAVAMGTGIWSMHFIGMLAFNLPQPVTYNLLTTLLSLLDVIITSGMALLLVSSYTLSWLRLLNSSVFMGLAIASMHYIGMAGMQISQGIIQYNPWVVGLSVEIGIFASFAALWLAFRLRDEATETLNWYKLGSAVIMGIAISGMHYTGMAAASFLEVEELTTIVPNKFNNSLLASGIALTNLLILGLTILSVIFDQRLAAQSAHEEILQESEKHFRMLIREMPIGVLLLTPDLKIIVSNQAAIDLLGIKDSQVLELGLVLQEDGTPFNPESLPMQQVLATCQPVHHVTIGIDCALSKTPRWLLVNADPQLSAEGTVERIVCTFSNITPAKQTESALRLSETREREKATQLSVAIQKLKQTQAKLVQTEKMFSLGQLVAGVAHEINNPVNFIYGNLTYVSEYAHNLLELVELYQQHYPHPTPNIQQQTEAIELDFLKEDLPKLLGSMKIGTERIRQIVLSLRNFSRYDEAEMKLVDIHQGIDSTLLILGHRLKAMGDNARIEVIKDYGDLPLVECYPGQLNQVFMNILSNGIDALEEARHKKQKIAEEKAPLSYQSEHQFPCIWIRTLWSSDLHSPQKAIDNVQPAPADCDNETDSILISIADNGSGMAADIQKQLFDPFFTTKSVGKGTGLGLAISYQIIVEKHGGAIWCESELGVGTEFWIKIPVKRNSISVG
ncbi:MAG: hypothetical protein F6J86_34525 [Symploca sp. SIO1B1]|nr:hypothetical protein [Symploca sp. SIO2D2]NER98887.1 hypothetical protein [Symploca sp. SIO1B1]